MMDIERQIAAFLHEEADRAALSAGMYQRVLRRAKIRRVVTATVAGLAVIATVMAGVVAAGALRSPSSVDPAVPGESPQPSATPRENGDGVHPTGPEVVVGQGTVSAKSWTLIAYESDAGLCVELELGDGRVGGCGVDVPETRDLSLGVGYLNGLSKSIVNGVVSKQVTALVGTLDSGEQLDVEIIEGPSSFGVNFFVAFLPPDAEGIVEARDDQGVVLQKERIRDLSEIRKSVQEAFTEEVLDDHKLTVYYPKGWNRASETLTPNLDQPTELLSLGTHQLSPGGEDCVQIPERSIESLGPRDAFITLQEASSGVNFPTRPKNFSAEDGEVSEAEDCLDNGEDIFFRRLRFKDEGRFFYAYVAIGDSASSQTRKDVWEILNALIFCDPASPPGDCL